MLKMFDIHNNGYEWLLSLSQVRVLPAMVLPLPKRNKNAANQNGRKDSASGGDLNMFLEISLTLKISFLIKEEC